MRAEFDGQDYALYLNKDTQELQRLKTQKLEAQLQQPFRGEDWDKKVVLEFGENSCQDGIGLSFLPETADGIWDKVKEVRVIINRRALGYVEQIGQFGTRYNGSDKIEIINGLPGAPGFL